MRVIIRAKDGTLIEIFDQDFSFHNHRICKYSQDSIVRAIDDGHIVTLEPEPQRDNTCVRKLK